MSRLLPRRNGVRRGVGEVEREGSWGSYAISKFTRVCVTRWRGEISILGSDQRKGKDGVLIGNESDERID
jgi:hypothetical protein